MVSHPKATRVSPTCPFGAQTPMIHFLRSGLNDFKWRQMCPLAGRPSTTDIIQEWRIGCPPTLVRTRRNQGTSATLGGHILKSRPLLRPFLHTLRKGLHPLQPGRSPQSLLRAGPPTRLRRALCLLAAIRWATTTRISNILPSHRSILSQEGPTTANRAALCPPTCTHPLLPQQFQVSKASPGLPWNIMFLFLQEPFLPRIMGRGNSHTPTPSRGRVIRGGMERVAQRRLLRLTTTCSHQWLQKANSLVLAYIMPLVEAGCVFEWTGPCSSRVTTRHVCVSFDNQICRVSLFDGAIIWVICEKSGKRSWLSRASVAV